MENEKQEELIEAPASEAEQVETTEQDPLKAELEKVQRKEGKTRAEKLLFKKKEIDRQIAEELGEDVLKTVEPKTEASDDDQPLTIGAWKKLEQEKAAKTIQAALDNLKSLGVDISKEDLLKQA